ncbi:MAG: hypothetical protein MUF49_19140 [Oculatellaceae cyanobacterium Prado106]|jgi:hypothetical protein|nr:hypothetical protein [Oculatellaceae cyanobacterium Prado106]
MRFHSKQLESGRWGIYQDAQLLATVGCSESCKEILNSLEKRKFTRRKHVKRSLAPVSPIALSFPATVLSSASSEAYPTTTTPITAQMAAQITAPIQRPITAQSIPS